MLVVGLGGIGTEVAKRAHALGMRVDATRASGRDGPPFVSYVGLPDELRKLAARGGLHRQHDAAHARDHRLFDAGFFAAVKQGAYFVNVGRGRSVVQAELVDALKSGRLAGAAST